MKQSGDWPQKAMTRMKCEGNNMNIEELKRLAWAATPGPWHVGFIGTFCVVGIGSDMQEPDAKYISAANPAAILELIRKRDEYQRQAEGIASEFNMIERERDEWKARYEFSVTVRNSLQQQQDELLAALDAIISLPSHPMRKKSVDIAIAAKAKAEE